jgi:hypothetical protein
MSYRVRDLVAFRHRPRMQRRADILTAARRIIPPSTGASRPGPPLDDVLGRHPEWRERLHALLRSQVGKLDVCARGHNDWVTYTLKDGTKRRQCRPCKQARDRRAWRVRSAR